MQNQTNPYTFVQKSKSIGGDYLQTLTIIESIKNCFDVGVIFESLNNARKRRFEMDMVELGYKKIYSLSRGMRRWNRWQKILTQCSRLKYEKNSLLASIC